jgi:predicted TIM-barrel fold metal-dependent hydrolase
MIIDFHTHIFPRAVREARDAFFDGEAAFKALYGSSQARLAGAEELIQAMDEDGIDRSVVFGFPWESEEIYRMHNDYIMEWVSRRPDRLIGFCCFSPLSPGGAMEARRCLDQGLSGVGELAVYQGGLSDSAIEGLSEVMAVCADKKAPLLLHTNEPVGHSYPGKTPMTLSQLYRFLKTYPSQPIVLAHWGGGIFFYMLMKKETQAVMANVWFDTAASPFLYRRDIYRLASEIAGADRILFGSDYPLIRCKRYMEEIAASGLDKESSAALLGGNAEKLLAKQQG